MRDLDREGIFKARPVSWHVKDATSGAVAVSFEFEIMAQWDSDSGWADWSSYDTHRCVGAWWVVKKNGQLNTGAVEQLRHAIGWTGDLRSVFGTPPETVVQITVKAEEYDGRTRFKAAWMNPEDYEPSPQGASEATVNQLQARYGSLLRAAATATGGRTAPAPAAPEAPPPLTEEDIPF